MIEFEVKDMSCGHCVGVVTQTIKLVDPDAQVKVVLGDRRIQISSDEDRSAFAEALKEAGYPPSL